MSQWWLGLLLLAHCFSCPSAAAAYDFKQVPLNLPQNSVLAVLQDQQGFLWLGTGTGLIKTNGISQQVFQHEPGNPTSLSQNHVFCLLQSSSGDIWITTMNGISRYPAGANPHHQFYNYLREPLATERQSNYISKIYQDSRGRIWAGSRTDLYLYQPERDQFNRITNQQQQSLPMVNQFFEINNTLWIGGNAGLARFNEQTQQFVTVSTLTIHYMARHASGKWLVSSGLYHQPEVFLLQDDGSQQLLPALQNYLAFYQDKQQLWAYGLENGLVKINADLTVTAGKVSSQQPINNNHPLTVFSILHAASGELLLSSNHGVFRYQPDSDSWQPMTVDKTHLASQVGTLFSTRDGTILLGSSQSGLFRYVPTQRKFRHYNPPRISEFDGHGSHGVRMIYEEQDQQTEWLWIGTPSYIKRLQLESKSREVLAIQNFDIRTSPIAATANSMLRLANGRLLLAASSGLQQFDPQRQQFIPAALQQLLPAPPVIPERAVKSIEVLDLLLTEHCLWLATNAGLGCASPDGSQILQWYDPVSYPAFYNNYLIKLYQASDQSLWLSTEQGVIRFDPSSKQLQQFSHNPADANSLAHNWVHGIWQSQADTFWIATREGGLNRLIWQPNQPAQWQRFGVAQGLPTEVLYGILGDTAGQLWLSSSNGIFRFDPSSNTVRHYQSADGLQSNEFNYSVMHIGQSGQYYFGGVNGVNGFVPAEVRDNKVAPQLALTGLQVNEQITALTAELTQSLSHNENYLTFHYTGLHFADPQRIKYAYQLVGNDQDWQHGSETYARYGALPAGNYQFWLKAANPDGVWSEPQLMLQLSIAPHPLRSPWALLIYALLALLALLGYKRFRDHNELLLQQKISQGVARETALNRSLQVQFDSTAHEMRTPLMRLGTRLERGIQALTEQHTVQALSHLQKAAQANTELQLLISRHLELEELRLRSGMVRLHLAAKPIIDNEINRYHSYFQEKQQQLLTDLQDLAVCALPGVLDLIVANLLSNACKYSPNGSIIRVVLQQQRQWLELTVADNGPGIAPEQQQDVFLRHYRLAGQENIPGSGEGLYLVKNAVQEAGGELRLISSPGQGCSFIIQLPLGDASQINSTSQPSTAALASNPNATHFMLPTTEQSAAAFPQQNSKPAAQSATTTTILVVEDNDGLREDLFELLSGYYHCITASDAATGWELAVDTLPDLIISDVMMEQKDSGFQLLQRLKSQVETSHIPVVLLTALGDEQSQQKGYSHQADVYLCKSANDQKLLAVVDTQLKQHRRITDHVRRALQQLPQGNQSTEKDKFLAKLEAVFSEIYADSSVTADVIARKFYKSTSQLNRMSKPWLNGSVIEALSQYRSQQAQQLLEDQNCLLTIEQIAEQCGFGNVKSLQRQWRSQFGVTPMQYRQGKRNPEQRNL